ADGQRLAPGESTIGWTITIFNADDQRVDYDPSAGADQSQNHAPVFDSDPLTTAQAGEAYVYTALTHDADAESVLYFLRSGPAGMTVDALTGRVSWSPMDAAPAVTHVVLEAYDTRGGRAEQAFDIAVAGGNHAPLFNQFTRSIDWHEGEELIVTLPV